MNHYQACTTLIKPLEYELSTMNQIINPHYKIQYHSKIQGPMLPLAWGDPTAATAATRRYASQGAPSPPSSCSGWIQAWEHLTMLG